MRQLWLLYLRLIAPKAVENWKLLNHFQGSWKYKHKQLLVSYEIKKIAKITQIIPNKLI